MFKNLRADLAAFQERDPAARSKFEIFLLYSGIHALIWHRIAHWFHLHHMKFLARWISQANRFFTGVEIHPAAKIGKGVMIDHGMGIVIGETAEVGDYCTLYQGVTLGGTGKDVGKRHPTVGNHVMIGAGAKVLGPFTVGDFSKIAANAVVLDAIPPHCTAVGVPARVVKCAGKKTCDTDLDQVHMPDPTAQELCALRIRLEKLEKALEQKDGI